MSENVINASPKVLYPTFSNAESAEELVKNLKQILKTYSFVSVCDLGNLLCEECPADSHKWGWSNLDDTYIEQYAPGEYMVMLPDCFCLDRMVTNPPHYQTKAGIEAIDVIDAFTEELVGREAVYTGNALKYICRWKHKNGLQDLKKAEWYLQRLIKHVENIEKGE